MKKERRLLAPFLMLLAGLIASITMYMMQYELQRMLGILLLTLVLFYIVGLVISKVIARFEAENEALLAAQEALEGEVIELDPDEDFDTEEADGAAFAAFDVAADEDIEYMDLPD
ncbi:MAG: hypothetical protein LBC96_06440 [Lachnospiraceae bacterium]|jgi:hypothetical protein|nr:hypothetical protein [Lachnospiraceae bacterium]